MVAAIFWQIDSYSWVAAISLLALATTSAWNYKAVISRMKRLAFHKHWKALFPAYSSFKHYIKITFTLLACGLLTIACLRPQWNEKEQVVEQSGRDLLIALDISRSMLCSDFSPNRLELAKLKIQNLLEQLGPERVGLVLFSGSAFVQCPFTKDFSALTMFLNQVDVQTISSGTTAIGKALERSIDLFERCPTRRHKLLLLITDGEDFSINLDHVISRAQSSGVTLLALGIGTIEGAPVPRINLTGDVIGFEIMADGKPALSKLNEPLLEQLVAKLDGVYQRTTYSNHDITQIQHKVETFEKEGFADIKLSRYEDQYPWFVALAGFFWMIAWIL